MNFYMYLKKEYGENEAIFVKDIVFEEYSKPWIKKELSKLCKEGKLTRYDKGIYYIPTKTLLGKSILDYKKVLMKKYIENGNAIFGYFSGITFLNMLGLSTQMPNKLEIYTNHETANIREVTVGGKDVILRRARTDITRQNASVLSFLELMNYTDADFYDTEKVKIITDFIKEQNITRSQITKYAPYYPDKALRTLVESEIIYHVAQG